MDIRCGQCNKLFRVADEKITGKGVKFSCTQCGDTIKITREDLDTYTLSKSAVSALDMFEPKPKPGATSIIEHGTAKASEQASDLDAVGAHPPLPLPKDLSPSSSSLPDFLQEKEESVISEPNPFEELSLGDVPQPKQETKEDESAIAIPFEPGPQQETGLPHELEEKKSLAHDIEIEPAKESKPQHLIPAEPDQKQEREQEQELKSTAALDLVPISKPELKPQQKPEEPVTQSQEAKEKPAIQPKPAPARTAVRSSMPNREPAQPVLEQTEYEVPETKFPHSRRMVLILLTAIILLSVAGYSVYKFMLPSMQNANQPATEMTSIEGLRVVNPSGSVEPNGDLLITGSVENLTDKERSGWYVVVEVYDANGKVLNKIRLLNGKQIYSHADYDVLAKRGLNVSELKAKSLQSQGVVIPAKGSVSFEMRYIQPPVGIASFNAVLQPFDPIRLFKEIEQETK